MMNEADREIAKRLEQKVMEEFANTDNPVAKFAAMSDKEAEDAAQEQVRKYIEARKAGHTRIPFEEDGDGSIREQIRDWRHRTGRDRD